MNKTVIFIDLDGTLIKNISANTFPEDISDFRIQLPILNSLILKFPNMQYMFIVSNQGGIGKYMEEDEFKIKLNTIITFCSQYINNYMKQDVKVDSKYCKIFDKKNPFRKPNTGMLEEFLQEYNITDLSQCIMIGDASGNERNPSNTDKKTAENMGIDYIDIDILIK
jgi:DNA 3'-phosphatase